MAQKVPDEIRQAAPAVARAVDILDLLAADPSVALTTSEIARALALPKSSTANLCAVLEASGMLRREHNAYSLGYKLLELGGRYLSSVDAVADFYATVRSLPDLGRETARLAALDGTEVIYLACAEGTQPLRIRTDVGDRLPASCTATGKAVLAQYDDDLVRARYSGVRLLPAYAPAAARDVPQLITMLDEVRERGYAVDDQETTPGVTCVGVAFASGPGTWMGISATVLSARWQPDLRDALLADLRTTAERLSLRTTMSAGR